MGAYGLIGMGAVFAGAARAPITAVVIMFELTGEYTIILPLMAAIVLATGVSHLLSPDTIYTLKLRRRGIDLSTPEHRLPLAGVTVQSIMEPTSASLTERTTLIDAADALSRAPHGQLPVLDGEERYRGIATAHAVADTLADGDHDEALIATVVEYPTPVRASDLVDHTLDALESAQAAVPVLDDGHTRLIGWLSHQRVLLAVYSASRQDSAEPPQPR